jgi:hypothetical protein
VPKDAPWAPPIVLLNDTTVGHLLCWELVELDGSWWGWVSWVQQAGQRSIHRVVSVRAGALRPLDDAEAYAKVRGECAAALYRGPPWLTLAMASSRLSSMTSSIGCRAYLGAGICASATAS